jgi:hypothetical protein
MAVEADGQSGRPRQIRAGAECLAVTALEAVRSETAAYPAQVGPRTVFVVRSNRRRFRLVHLLRDSRWTIEELASHDMGRTRAA